MLKILKTHNGKGPDVAQGKASRFNTQNKKKRKKNYDETLPQPSHPSGHEIFEEAAEREVDNGKSEHPFITKRVPDSPPGRMESGLAQAASSWAPSPFGHLKGQQSSSGSRTGVGRRGCSTGQPNRQVLV